MQYVNCLYSAQGEYVCQKNERLDAFYDKPIVEGFEENADKKKENSYGYMTSNCTKPNTKEQLVKCIDALASFYNLDPNCKKNNGTCSPLSGCVQTRQNSATCKINQCADPVFSKAMIADGTNYITKKNSIPLIDDMPVYCKK